MKRILLGAVAAFAVATAAHADPFAVAYGNTVTQTYNGKTTTLYVNETRHGSSMPTAKS
jgi:hypothetical protein